MEGTTGMQAATIPKYFFFSATCIQTKVYRALQGGTATLGYLNLKNPEF